MACRYSSGNQNSKEAAIAAATTTPPSTTRADTATKNRALGAIAAEIRAHEAQLMEANRADLEHARAQGRDAAFIDRLTLGRSSIAQMAEGLEQVAALRLRQMLREPAPPLRLQPCHVVEPPACLRVAQQPDAAEHEAPHAVGVRFGVVQRERAPPRAAEHQPPVDAQMPAQRLDVLDQDRRRVAVGLAQGRGAPGAALVEDDDAVGLGVEEAAVRRDRAPARPAAAPGPC